MLLRLFQVRLCGDIRALRLTSLLRLACACPSALIVGLPLALTPQEILNLLSAVRVLRGGTQVQRPIARDERLSHGGSKTVLRLRLVGVAAPHGLARGCAKLSSSTIRHRGSLNKAVSQKLELL